jgi:hypothetical protein
VSATIEDIEQIQEWMLDQDTPMAPWAPRQAHVYWLEITYPAGSKAPGWKPEHWDELLATLDRPDRRKAARRGFRWPRERMFLSGSSAYHRANLLTWCGAAVQVHRSFPVMWPWVPGDVEFDASGIPVARELAA